MNALTFWEAATGAAAVGFAVGWLAVLFLGLWCYVTLIIHCVFLGVP